MEIQGAKLVQFVPFGNLSPNKHKMSNKWNTKMFSCGMTGWYEGGRASHGDARIDFKSLASRELDLLMQ
jgi:hypothetical protein